MGKGSIIVMTSKYVGKFSIKNLIKLIKDLITSLQHRLAQFDIEKSILLVGVLFDNFQVDNFSETITE